MTRIWDPATSVQDIKPLIIQKALKEKVTHQSDIVLELQSSDK